MSKWVIYEYLFLQWEAIELILQTEIFGEGEPLIFLHTGLQTGMTDFEYQREYFKDKYKVILPDLRGHGKSVTDVINKDFFEDSAKDLEETLAHLDVESAHIIGCSLGGLAGLCFAKRFPHRVESLVLSGVIAEKPEDWLERHREEVESQRSLLEDEKSIKYFNALHESDWRQFLKLAREEDWYPFDLTKDLNGIHSPVLYMVGDGYAAECKSALMYQSLHEEIHVAIIPFAAHLVHDQQPDLYSRILQSFLEKRD